MLRVVWALSGVCACVLYSYISKLKTIYNILTFRYAEFRYLLELFGYFPQLSFVLESGVLGAAKFLGGRGPQGKRYGVMGPFKKRYSVMGPS